MNELLIEIKDNNDKNIVIPEYKNKKIDIKNNAKNIIFIMKILCFVDTIKID